MNDQKIRFRVFGLSDRIDPTWKICLERQRNSLKQDIARLIQISTVNASRQVRNNVQKVYRNYVISSTTVVEILDTLKQKLSITCGWLRRYSERHFRHTQNATYPRNRWSFSRLLNEFKQSVQTVQFSVTEAKEYWGEFWGLPGQYVKWIPPKEFAMPLCLA